MKMPPGAYQYTAIDDCSRCCVLGVYLPRSGKYTVDFLERVIEQMLFAIQRDLGTEFFAERVQR